jgi:2-C-methyl-D-erythritol 2,4-cyclodiphosphate synthase
VTNQATRVGIGYDIHRLVEGRKLVLGGVDIPFEKGLDGHSDADVLSHSIIDALLGAAALGDIGQHFPDDDPRYKDASSITMMRLVEDLLRSRGWRVHCVDATILAEQPKLAPHIERIRARLARALCVNTDCVSVKAKTHEGLGSIGAGQAIAVHAVCLLGSELAGKRNRSEERGAKGREPKAKSGERRA